MNGSFSSRVAAGKGVVPRSSMAPRISPAGAIADMQTLSGQFSNAVNRRDNPLTGAEACYAAGGSWEQDPTGKTEFTCVLPGPIPARLDPSRIPTATGDSVGPAPSATSDANRPRSGTGDTSAPTGGTADRRTSAPGTGDASRPPASVPMTPVMTGYTPTGIPSRSPAPVSAYCVPEWVTRNPWGSVAPSSDWRQGSWPGGTYQTQYSAAAPAPMPSALAPATYLATNVPGYYAVPAKGAGAVFISDDSFLSPAINALAVFAGMYVGYKIGEKVFR